MGSGKRMLVKGCQSVQEEHHWDGMNSVVTVSVLAVLTCLGQAKSNNIGTRAGALRPHK